jgi:hypothetical protein
MPKEKRAGGKMMTIFWKSYKRGDSAGFIWERSNVAMNFLRKNLLLFISFSTYLFVAGCDNGDIGDRGIDCKKTYSLVNNTDGSLYYKAHHEKHVYDDVFVFNFDTTLLPNDTLLLYFYYEGGLVPPGEDYTGFHTMSYYGYYKTGELTIRDNTEYLVLYRSEKLNCGETIFIEKEKSEGKYYYLEYHYYWTIDSTYITEKSCNMSLDELKKFYLDEE